MKILWIVLGIGILIAMSVSCSKQPDGRAMGIVLAQMVRNPY